MNNVSQQGQVKTVLLNDTSENNHYGCVKVVENIRLKCGQYGLDLVHTVPLAENWDDQNHLEQIRVADIVLVNGEGTMHHSKGRCRRLASVARFCKEHNTRSHLINSVYQDNDAEIAELARCFDAIFVRESRSRDELRRHGIEARVVPDMFFATDATAISAGSRSGAVYSDSVDAEVTEMLFEKSASSPDGGFVTMHTHSSEPSIGSRVEMIVKDQLVTVLGSGAPGKWRKQVNKWKKSNQRARYMQYRSDSFASFLELISGSELVVTGRFHMACTALLTETPFVCLPSNSHKIEGLLEDAGLEDRMISIADLEQDLSRFAKWSEKERLSVSAFTASAKREIDSMFNFIRNG